MSKPNEMSPSVEISREISIIEKDIDVFTEMVLTKKQSKKTKEKCFFSNKS
jgi:hypothetical protein